MRHNELTVGEVRAMYFDASALTLPPVPLYRMDVKGDRHYFSVNDEGQPEFYTGVTTLTSRMLPKDEHLIKWIADKGYDAAIAYRNERGKYGTLMHTLFASFLIDRTINLDMVDSYVSEYCTRERLDVNEFIWSEDLKQDLLALAQWVQDYNVRPLAIEISLCDPETGIAGTVDMPCIMDIPTEGDWGEKYASGARKGEVKITKKAIPYACIVDFKSGRNYPGGEANAAQLRLYEKLLRANFPNIFDLLTPDQFVHTFQNHIKLFNWSPKDWRTTPGYNLTDQTSAFSDTEAELMIDWWRVKQERSPVEAKTKVFFKGHLDLDETLSEYYTSKTINEIASDRLNDLEVSDIEAWKYDTLEDLLKPATDDPEAELS